MHVVADPDNIARWHRTSFLREEMFVVWIMMIR